jgi:hypothetical protein
MKTIFAATAMLVFLPTAWADGLTDAYQREHEYQRGYNDGWMDRALGLPTMIPEMGSSARMNGYDDGVSDENMLNEGFGRSPIGPGRGGDDAQ